MHLSWRYGFIENLDAVPHLPLGRVGRTRIAVTPTVWLFPVVFVLFRLLLDSPNADLTPSARLHGAIVFTIGVAIFTLVHAAGHVLAGRLAGSAMDELLFTATRGVNIYNGDQTRIPAHVHLGRALGGPLANLLCVLALDRLLPLAGGGFVADVIASTASTNLVAGIGSFLPLPSLDGHVIWRELFRLRLQSGRRA